MKSTTV